MMNGGAATTNDHNVLNKKEWFHAKIRNLASRLITERPNLRATHSTRLGTLCFVGSWVTTFPDGIDVGFDC